MVPAGVVDATLHDLAPKLGPATSSSMAALYYIETSPRQGSSAKGIHYVDVGTSAGLGTGARLLPDDRRRNNTVRTS